MKKIDMSNTIQIFANVAIVAGIIFLAYELQQNNQLLRSEAISNIFAARMYINEQWVSNPEFAAIWQKNRNNEVLTDLEKMRIEAAYSRVNMGWQREYFLYQEGIIPENYFKSNISVMKNVYNNPGTLTRIEHWNNWKNGSDPSFRDFYEKCIIADCETIPN